MGPVAEFGDLVYVTSMKISIMNPELSDSEQTESEDSQWVGPDAALAKLHNLEYSTSTEICFKKPSWMMITQVTEIGIVGFIR
jgi:hypothetical protein